MSTLLCDLVVINAIQDRLDAVYSGKSQLTAQKTPLLDYVMSTENKNAFDIEKRITSDGKLKDLEVRFKQAKLASEVSENLSGCEATGEVCETSHTYSFDSTANVGMDFALGISELATNPETNTATIAEEIRLRMDAIKLKVHENLCDMAVANLGGWSSDTSDIEGVAVTADILNVNTTLPQDSNALRVANPVLFEQLQTALEMSDYGSTGIFGGTELASYVKRAMAGSDSVVGYNLLAMLQQYGIGATYDRVLAAKLAAAGSITNLAVGIGSIAPVGWSIYNQDGAKIQSADSVADTIYDPATGMMFEFRMTRPCDEWLIQIRTRYEFKALPPNRYKTGHPLEGVNGIGGINVNCDNLQSCIA